MAAELYRLAEHFEVKGLPDFAGALRVLAQEAERRGVPFIPDGLLTRQDRLQLATEEYATAYEEGILTPELIDTTWRLIWGVWGERVGHRFVVPMCDRTKEELQALRAELKGVVLVPDELYTPIGLELLDGMFPEMRSAFIAKGSTAINASDVGGCIDIEMTVGTPNKGTKEKDLFELFASQGREGQRGPTYVIGSQFSRLTTGSYFDQERSVSRLPGFWDRGARMLAAHFDPQGRLYAGPSLGSELTHPKLGGRSEGMKVA